MALLYVAGISISENIKDIPEKTLNIIKNSNIAIGEERKVANKLLQVAGSSAELFLINEHTEDNARYEILEKVKNTNMAVFFSDAGTPCISDPDYKFISMCKKNGIKVLSLPGASSITSAISVSGIEAKTFYFAGFPPRDNIKRRKFFEDISKNKVTTVFMERPYALSSTIKDMAFINKKISLSLNLGCENEENYYDFPKNLIKYVENKKAPFVVVIGNHKK